MGCVFIDYAVSLQVTERRVYNVLSNRCVLVKPAESVVKDL